MLLFQRVQKGPSCKHCGTPTKSSNKSGYCAACLEKPIIEVPCACCGKIVSLTVHSWIASQKYNKHPIMCRSCINLHCAGSRQPKPKLVTVTCPDCGETRQIKRLYAEFRDRKAMGFRCNTCAAIDRVPSRGKIVINRSEIRINGCVLKPAREGQRCDDHSTCPNGAWAGLIGIPKTEDCTLVVGRRIWNGWRCTPESKPGIMTEEQRQIVWEDQCGAANHGA